MTVTIKLKNHYNPVTYFDVERTACFGGAYSMVTSKVTKIIPLDKIAEITERTDEND